MTYEKREIPDKKKIEPFNQNFWNFHFSLKKKTKTKTISNEPDLDLLEAFGLRFFFMILGSQIIMFSVAWKMLPEKSGLTYS